MRVNFGSNLGQGRIYTNVHGKLGYIKNQGNYKFKAAIIFRQTSRQRNGRNNTYRYRDFAGNLHFGWKNKYFFGLSSSYSGSNLLPADNRYGFFPAISGGWMLSREDFLKSAKFLDRLKLRASWGMVGSSNLPANEPFRVNYGPGGGGYWFRDGYQHQGGYVERSIKSPNFTFATSYNTNIGLDATLFDKLELTVDWFYERRENILTGTGGQYSQILGISSPIQSNGIVKNHGIDASLNWHHAVGNVAYRIGGQFSFARNKIININEPYRPHSYLSRTGRPVGQRFGLQAIGFFKDQKDITNSPEHDFSEVNPGDIKYKDQNEDGIINQYDEVPLGFSSGYPQIYFSVSLGVNYKSFEISALFQGTGNYTAYLNTKSVFWPIQNNNTISKYYYNRRWTPASTTASYPRLTTKHSDNNFRPNSVWLVDRSFIKLRNLEVSYSLPKSFIQSLALSDIRIIGQGRNIFSVDDIPALDPEYLGTGYPLLRSYSLGLKIEF